MKKNIEISHKLLENWASDLEMNWRSEKGIPIMVLSALSMETLSTVIPHGCYLGKQTFRLETYPIDPGVFLIQPEITKQKKIKETEYIFCQTRAFDSKGCLVLNIETVLIKPEKRIPYMETSWERANDKGQTVMFSVEQVHNYSQLSGDPNPIHLTNRPVVPGMLLMLGFEERMFANDTHPPCTISVQYLHPLYGGEKVVLIETTQGFEGWALGRKICMIDISGGIEYEKVTN